MASLGATVHSKAVVHMAIERARFSELLAPLLNKFASRLYLLGILSLIDVILAMLIKQVPKSLPLEHQIKSALMGKKSSLSEALDLARCHETGDWQQRGDIKKTVAISDDAASTIYVDALQWADQAAQAML